MDVNPLANGLRYLPQIETGAFLSTAGEDGTAVGAQILKQYGKSGTMWGDAGYNELQDGIGGRDNVSLWPFPNEALIREKMAAPITLTSYVWEYLGSPCPEWIYVNFTDANPPAAPVN